MQLILFVVLAVLCLNVEAKLEAKLVETLREKKQANVFVVMKKGSEQVVREFERMESNFESRGAKIESLTNRLAMNAKFSQKKVMAAIESFNKLHESSTPITSESFWISNSVFIPAATEELLNHLATLEDVESVHEEHIIVVEKPVFSSPFMSPKLSSKKLEWGLDMVKTSEAWKLTSNKGKGVVVANIDTGVMYDHEALQKNFRKKNGWLDPYSQTTVPTDSNGHGTHTMGTIAGQNGIGVAPDAEWIACRGCGQRSCTEKALLACGQWTACPTNTEGTEKDCASAPHLVSNSWGGGQGNTWYNGVIKVWQASGIIPVFAMGNSGPSCGTANSPGDQDDVIAVGATDSSDRLAYFSSVGPRRKGGIKPDISAPGHYVRSAWINGKSSYRTISGTSMACPHVAGGVALLLAAKPTLTYQAIYKALTSSTAKSMTKPGKNCGGVSENKFPNNMYGHGRMDIFKALKSL